MKNLLRAILCGLLSMSALSASGNQHLKSEQIEKLIQAVQDEIYDYGYYRNFYEIGENLGTPEHWKARVRIFINPVYDSAGRHGQVIYKLMPIGQVYRLFYIDPNGDAKLDGDPQNHFPITQPSHQTVFMDDLDVCQLEHHWMNRFFVVDTEPTLDIIKSAAERQKVRTGFSDWEYEHSDNK